MKFKLIFPVLFFTILLTSCESNEEIIEEKSVPVKIYETKPELIINYLDVVGSVTATEDVIIYSKVSERIDNINVKPGERVKKDQILASQYNMIFKQSVNAAESGVKSAETQFKQILSDYERMEKLFNQKAVSPQQFEQIKTQKETANLAYEQSMVQLGLAKEQFQNSVLKAPFDGTVAAIFVEKNQMLMAGQPVFQVLTPKSMKAKVNISSRDIGKIFRNQNVRMKFPSIPRKDLFRICELY